MCGETMTFPDTVEEFMERYKIVDREQVYSNGAEYVPIFRMKQWFEHISDVPTIKAEPVRHGRWINTGEIWTDMYTADEDPIYKCSVCNAEVIGGSKHFVWCPWCGAKMEEQEDD